MKRTWDRGDDRVHDKMSREVIKCSCVPQDYTENEIGERKGRERKRGGGCTVEEGMGLQGLRKN